MFKMSKLIRFDWAIKYLLRNKANFDVLEGFLSELLKTDIQIESVLESEGNKNHADDKFNRVDLLVRTSEGQHVIIEVQCSYQWDYLGRILYGASKAVCEYIREGDTYRQIRKVISVSIVFFNLGEGKDYLYRGSTTFTGIHYHDTLNLNPQERDIYAQPGGLILQTPEEIFPEYYIIKVTAFHERVQDKFDEWIYLLKHGEIKKEFAAKGIQSAAKKLDVLRLNETERRQYEKFQENLHDSASWCEMMRITQSKLKAAEQAKLEADAKTEIEKAKAETEKAKAEIAEAKAETEKTKAEIAEAKAETEKTKAEITEAKAEIAKAEGIQLASEEIALQLLKENWSDEKIAALTHLSIERVRMLRQSEFVKHGKYIDDKTIS
jgi:predicted transposase/invertase (TIGR01784 family)